MDNCSLVNQIKENINRVFVGKEEIVENLLICLLAGGHINTAGKGSKCNGKRKCPWVYGGYCKCNEAGAEVYIGGKSQSIAFPCEGVSG